MYCFAIVAVFPEIRNYSISPELQFIEINRKLTFALPLQLQQDAKYAILYDDILCSESNTQDRREKNG